MAWMLTLQVVAYETMSGSQAVSAPLALDAQFRDVLVALGH